VTISSFQIHSSSSLVCYHTIPKYFGNKLGRETRWHSTVMEPYGVLLC